MDQVWHIECFQCSQCARSIEDEGFTVRKDQPWCSKCIAWSSGKMVNEKVIGGLGHEKKTGTKQKVVTETVSETIVTDPVQPSAKFDTMQGFKVKICTVCNKTINYGVDYQNKSFCVSCFTCNDCGNIIDPNEGFIPLNGSTVQCTECQTKKGNKLSNKIQICKACGTDISGKFVKLGSNVYHKTCFRCDECQSSLESGYAEVGSQKLCVSCVDTTPTVVQGISVHYKTGDVKSIPIPPKGNFCGGCGSPASGKFCGNCGKLL